MATQDNAYIQYTGSNGVQKVLPTSKDASCELRPTPLSTAQIAQLINEPATPSGYVRRVRSCSNEWSTYADAVNSGYTDIVDPDPDPQPPVDSGQTVITATGNTDVLNPVVESQNGKWRYRNTAIFDVPSGKKVYVFEDGQVGTTNPSQAYRFNPGDAVSVLVAVSDSPDSYVSYFFRNASTEIKFGNT